MMPRRERNNSSVSFNRSREQLRSTSEDNDIGTGVEEVAYGSQGKLYEIKDIIGENRNSYLIDWKDDADTGEKYPPSWVCRQLSYYLWFHGVVW